MTTASGTREVPFARPHVWRALTALTPYCSVCDVSYVFSETTDDGGAATIGKGTRFVCVRGRLEGAPPPPNAVSGEIVEWVAQPVDITLPLQGDAGSAAVGSVQITVDPAATGPNTLMVYLFDEAGQLAQPQDIRVTLTETDQQIGPLQVDLMPAGPGHYIGDAMSIPTPGTWTLTVSVRLDEFTAATANTDFAAR